MGQSASIPFERHREGSNLRLLGSPAQTRPELTQLAERLMSVLAANGVAIAIQSKGDPGTMVCAARSGNTAPALGAILDINSGISGQAARENCTLFSNDTETDSRVDKEACKRLGIRSVVAAPLSRRSKCIGILEVFSSNPQAFDAEAVNRIEAEAVRALALLDRPGTEVQLPNPENFEQTAAFKLNPDGRVSAIKSSFELVPNENRPALFSSLTDSHVSLGRRWRWIAIASVAASLAFSAQRLLH